MAVQMQTFNSREEWLAGRTSRIGGSDAAAILGLNPWKSNADLFREKIGAKKPDDIGDEDFVIFGNNAEPLMREMFKLDYPQFNVEYVENNFWTNSDFPFAHASLDGWLEEKDTGRKGILEIKTSNILNAGMTEKWKDRIPDNYYCQVLHYLMVTDFDFALLKARLRWEAHDDREVYCQIRHYRIERKDCEEDIKMLAEAEAEFAEKLKSNKRPDLILPEI